MEPPEGTQVHGKYSPHRIENLFFLNGITSLLGWNVILTSMDYFHYVYSDYNVYLYFPIPVFIAYALTGVTFNELSTRYEYRKIVTVGITGTNICIGLMLLVSFLTKNSMDLGFWICILLSFGVGLFSNIAQLSFYGMINFLGFQVVSRYTIGTAAGGLFINILRIIIVAILGSDQSAKTPIILYICIALVFNFYDLSINIRFFKSKFYQEKIQAPHLHEDQQPQQQVIYTDQQQSTTSNSDVLVPNKKKKFSEELKGTLKSVHPYPLFIFINYIITFMLFPNLSLARSTDLPGIWTVLLFLFTYNLGDFAGKIIGDFRGSFNALSMVFLFFSRLFFFYTIPMMVVSYTQEDHVLNNNFFPFINQFLFALTNGFVTNGCFILSFENAPKRYKKYAGVVGGLALQMGIMLGTFLALPLDKWVNPITGTGRYWVYTL